MTTALQLPELSEKDQARFWSKVALPNGQGCMLWARGTTAGGYGEIKIRGQMVYAHRLSYVLAYGPIPEDLTIDHVKTRGCTSTRCVAPAHLEAVTSSENSRRSDPGARQRAKTHCINDHAFDEVNTYRRPTGGRDCKTCKYERIRRSRQRRRDAAAGPSIP